MSGDALNDLALLIKSVELSGAVRQMAVRKLPIERALLTLDEVYFVYFGWYDSRWIIFSIVLDYLE